MAAGGKLEDFSGKRVLYCYLDEAGDFNFSLTGTPYYIYTALVTEKPLGLQTDLLKAKYELVLNNLPFSKSHRNNDYFHATEDAPMTRELAYGALAGHVDEIRIYSIIVQKNKTNPSVRDERKFFSMIMRALLEDIVRYEGVVDTYDHLCIMTDRIPVQKKRDAIIGPIKKGLSALLGEKISYSLAQMDSKSDFGLQAADYCSWAIHRWYTNGDDHYLDKLRPAVRHLADFFRNGTTIYY